MRCVRSLLGRLGCDPARDQGRVGRQRRPARRRPADGRSRRARLDALHRLPDRPVRRRGAAGGRRPVRRLRCAAGLRGLGGGPGRGAVPAGRDVRCHRRRDQRDRHSGRGRHQQAADEPGARPLLDRRRGVQPGHRRPALSWRRRPAGTGRRRRGHRADRRPAAVPRLPTVRSATTGRQDEAAAGARAARLRRSLRPRVRRRERLAELERAVHLDTSLGAAPGLASSAPAVFAAAAATGRISGNALLTRLRPAQLLVAGGAVAAVGSLLAATAGNPWVALVGIGIAGLGTSVCAPTIISMAGAWAGPEGRAGAISTVTTIAYLGFLLGPAAVGAASSVWSLPAALAGVAVLAVVVAALGPVAGRAATRQRT
ncbi:MFS transporter [Kribbella sp. CA-253562]|uniref:MFS transporter n=1 Tax=Kribbella sp. CA-253562 TaxID=3239942 RepID=UPI003D937BEB